VLVLQRSHAPGLGADHVRYSVVEANRFLLRDLGGSVSGGLESVLGRLAAPRARQPPHGIRASRDRARRHGAAHVARARRHRARRARRSDQPSAWLSPTGGEATVAMRTRDDGGGEVLVKDAQGLARFRAP
jgi:hypothetical protein